MQKDADDPLDKPQSVSSNVDFHVPSVLLVLYSVS